MIQNKGSDTLVNVAQVWAENYRQVNPKVAVALSGGGTGTGIAALINGTADIANASRIMTADELASARARRLHPQEFVVGHDAIAVFLHPNNPLSALTVAQLSDVYGEHGGADRWSQLGVTVPGCASDRIVRLGRQNNSGTSEYFREVILGESGEYKLGIRDLQGSQEVAEVVSNTPCAIGYSGLAYASKWVKLPCITGKHGCVAPSVATAADGTYVMARPLFMYTPNAPTGAVRDYLDWVLSDVGQCLLERAGYAAVRNIQCSPPAPNAGVQIRL